MKNAINYYYDLFPNDIHQKKSSYNFNYNSHDYTLLLYKEDISTLKAIYDFHIFLLNNNVFIHQIILNKMGQILTNINNESYILLKVNSGLPNKTINLNDVWNFSNSSINLYTQKRKYNYFEVLKRENLFTLWSNKNDHLEYQISQLEKKYPLIKESFNYYIGLGETAIQLISKVPTNAFQTVIAHKRINSKSTLFDLYNPLNLIIDSRARDVSEYFKSKFFYQDKTVVEQQIFSFFINSYFTATEFIIFFARMMYPTYYFDIYEKIISGIMPEKEIKKITSQARDYEKLLRNIYKYYKSFLQIEIIEWLEN